MVDLSLNPKPLKIPPSLADEYLAGAGAVEGLGSKVIKNDNPSWNCSDSEAAVLGFRFGVLGFVRAFRQTMQLRRGGKAENT